MLAAWWAFGRTVIDEVLATDPAPETPTVPQLWPEHFDLGCDVGRGGSRINLGASPGDGYVPSPYIYVGPRSSERPGDDRYWNAPFGAVLERSQIDRLTPSERRSHAIAFLVEGLSRF